MRRNRWWARSQRSAGASELMRGDSALSPSDAALQSLRRLPAVDVLLQMPAIVDAAGDLPRPLVVDVVRELLNDVRTRLLAGEVTLDVEGRISNGAAVSRSAKANGQRLEQQLAQAAVRRLHAARRRFLTRVVNATGVVLHTNLGRAPLSEAALQAVKDVAAGYSNLEYSVDAGRRGSRHDYCEAMLTRLTGAEAAMVVNNNAAAVLLVLSALAHGREVILSRGEMIEIGGSFRIPEVMEQSGCVLREVGTTNRTHLHDYERVVDEHTAAILKVHPSNYKISGFTASVSAAELAPLASRHGIPLIEDLGSGVLVRTERYGLTREPTVQESVAAGVDVVTFSGDKLLGGPQAGIIVGRKDLIERCKAHPLARALRVDKMTLAALQATLSAYLDGDVEEIPVYAMLDTSVERLWERAAAIVDAVRGGVAVRSGAAVRSGGAPGGDGVGSETVAASVAAGGASVQIEATNTLSTVGGGSLPGATLPGAGVALRIRHNSSAGATADRATAARPWTPDVLAAALRRGLPPIVGRIDGDVLLLDLRTVHPDDDELIARRLTELLNDSHVASSEREATP